MQAVRRERAPADDRLVVVLVMAADFANSFVVMPVDGAPWHPAPKLQVPETICLITHPADSPERNPIAHRWDDIRETAFPNMLHESLEQVQAVVSTGLRRRAATPENLASMTFFPHLRVAWRQLA